MTFSYDLATPIGKVRFQLGDGVEEGALLTDEEIQHALGERGGSVLLAAADLCGMLAARFAREFDFDADGQGQKRSQRAKAFRELRAELIAEADEGEPGSATASVGVISVTRDRGFDDDDPLAERRRLAGADRYEDAP